MNGKDIQSDEAIARGYRERLGVDHLRWLDPMTILMKVRDKIGIDFVTVPSAEIAPALAKWDSQAKLIRIADDIFAAANFPRSDGRARFSIFHEVVHALEGHGGIFNRLPSRSEIPKYARRLRALERNTDGITAAFIAPRHLIANDCSAAQVASSFGISVESARIRLEHIRGRTRRGKPLPDDVEQLLRDLKRRE